MYIQDPSNVGTDFFLVVGSIGVFMPLFLRYRFKTLVMGFFTVTAFFFILMSFFGLLFHINNQQYFLLQKYGTMISSGLAGLSLTLACIYDNYRSRTALVLAGLLAAGFLFYLYAIINDYKYIYFLVLQSAYFIIVMIAYFKKLLSRSTRAVYMYAGAVTFGLAAIAQASNLRIFVLDHNDLFHFILMIFLYCYYKAVNAESPSPQS